MRARLETRTTMFRILTAVVLSIAFVFSVGMVWDASLWPDAAAQASIYLLAAVIALWVAIERVSFQFSWFLLPFAALPIWGLLQLSLGLSTYRFGTWQGVLAFGSIVIALALGLFAFRTRHVASTFQVGAVVFGGALSLLALLQLVFAAGRIYFVLGTGHAMGPFVNRDHYSALIELLLPIAVWSAIKERRNILLVLYAGITAIMYASIVAGASRAGVSIATVELAAVVVLAWLKHRVSGLRLPFRTILILACFVLALSAAVGWRVVLGRFAAKNPLAYRKDFWKTSIHMIKDSPIYGFGIGSWQWVYPRYETVDPGAIVRHAHNDWLEWTCDGGLILLIAFLLIAAYSLWLGWLYPWALGPAMVFAHSLVDFPLQNYPIFLGLVLILAAAEACRLENAVSIGPISVGPISREPNLNDALSPSPYTSLQVKSSTRELYSS